MDKPESWIAECRVRTGAESQEYICKAAVWADSQESLRARLIAHLSNEDIHLLEVVQALPVFAYFRVHGPDPKLAELSQKVHSGMLAVRGPLVANVPLPVAAGADKPAETLEEALLQLKPEDGPVFAVLDGAQFDDLPKALFDGDFVHRPLYKDNAIGNEDRAKTAPQMVWLDEREERASGRTHKETVPVLLELVEEKPAAVFWQCPAGAEALYKHLRRINMVMIPEGELPDGFRNDEISSEETHAMVLFRHADANVMEQTLCSMTTFELANILGPAKYLLFMPSRKWAVDKGWSKIHHPNEGVKPISGPLRLCQETLDRIAGKRRSTSTSSTLSKDDELKLYSFLRGLDFFKDADQRELRIAIKLAAKFQTHAEVKSPNGLAWAIIISYLSIKYARFKVIRRKIFDLKGWSFDQLARIIQIKSRRG